MVTVHAARNRTTGIRRHATSASPGISPGKHGFGSRRVTDRRADVGGGRREPIPYLPGGHGRDSKLTSAGEPATTTCEPNEALVTIQPRRV
jgi:hypothetical protein